MTRPRLLALVLLPMIAACGAGTGMGGSTAQSNEAEALVQTNSPVIINEVLANEPGSNTAGEFVELVNTGSTAVDLSGWTISDSSSVRHVFASGTTLAAGAAYVVFGGSSAIPSGLSNAVAASTGSLSLGNSGDSVVLEDSSGAVMGRVDYTRSLSGTDGVSMNRDPDGTASDTFVLHTTLSSSDSSPGTKVDGTPFTGTGTGEADAGSGDGGGGGGTGTAHVFINEILANEPGSSTSGEFVELVNSGDGTADLSGWTISDSSEVRHQFADGTSLAPGAAYVVFGGSSAIPSGLSNAVAASTGSLGLNNGGDTVTLADGSGNVVDSETYASALASEDGVSMNRDPDGDASGTFVLHDTLSSLSNSPGTRVDGSAFDGSTPPPADGGTPPPPEDGGTPPPPPSDGGTVRIRLMGANISSGNYQSYDPGEGARIFEGLHPDVAMIQEFNYGDDSDSAIRTFVDNTFGTNFYVYREPGGVQIPNGIVSRYPIVQAGDWTDTQVGNRDFVWARIDIPGPHDLWAISVHLLTKGSTYRSTEASELVNDIQTNVPSGDFVVIGGDFNTDSRSEAAISTFSAVFDTSAPYPADGNGNGNTNASRSKPYDWVLVNPGLRPYQVPVVIGPDTFPGGLVFDSRVFTPLSAVSPVEETDSAAVNMQHMAVVKDFELPN